MKHVIETSRRLRLAAMAGATILIGTAFALTLGTSRGQDAIPGAASPAADEWHVDPLRGPIDLGLTDPSLIGAIDVHEHVDPDAPGTGGVIRALDVFEAAAMAKARGMRGFVYKTHQEFRIGERRLSHPQAWRARRRNFRPHGVELLHRRHQCRGAGAFFADQGRLGANL